MERVFPMIIGSDFRIEKYRDDDHREDAPHFTKGLPVSKRSNIAELAANSVSLPNIIFPKVSPVVDGKSSPISEFQNRFLYLF